MVRQGQVSRARQVLTSSGLAPGNHSTLDELKDPILRPPVLSMAVPQEVLTFTPATRPRLNRFHLTTALRSAHRGSAADLSGTK